MKKILPLLVSTLLLGLSSCNDADVITIYSTCTKGRILGPSCNGTLIQLTEDDQTVGKTITYNGTIYHNVFGTYSALPATSAAGTEVTFQLRSVTTEEATSQPCLAIYQGFDVPQLAVENVGCRP
ncbi:hypothetical protein [Hymenobacter swuensis]|uniref:hypothetical protein n=1 Tax=Hymenobacter swuensis TaxID=1446467 RepID=UPI0005C58BDD|nr:hypothetical protein [Hymenobacter swuensis]